MLQKYKIKYTPVAVDDMDDIFSEGIRQIERNGKRKTLPIFFFLTDCNIDALILLDNAGKKLKDCRRI